MQLAESHTVDHQAGPDLNLRISLLLLNSRNIPFPSGKGLILAINVETNFTWNKVSRKKPYSHHLFPFTSPEITVLSEGKQGESELKSLGLRVNNMGW